MGNNQIEVLVGGVLFVFVLVGLIKGAARTFRRNWVLALILMLALTPIWLIWAIIEALTNPTAKDEVPVPPIPSTPTAIQSSSDANLQEIKERADRARSAILSSGNQQLIDHLHLMDAVAVSAGSSGSILEPAFALKKATQSDVAEPMIALSIAEKMKLRRENRQRNHPVLWKLLNFIVLFTFILSVYSTWRLVRTRSTPEYIQCLQAHGDDLSQATENECTSETFHRTFFGE